MHLNSTTLIISKTFLRKQLEQLGLLSKRQ